MSDYMTFKTFPLRRLLLPALMVFGLLAVTRIALAVPAIADIQPRTISNVTGGNLAVTGSGFITDSVVILDGFGALVTTRVSDGLLTGDVPAGLAPGNYTVRVVNADGTAVAPAQLTITGPTPTPAPTAFVRPLLVVISYGASSPRINPGENLDFEMTFQNAGQSTATNVVATFVSGDFLPRVTGGVRAVGNIGPGQTARFFQPLYATTGLVGKRIATLEVKVSYTSDSGAVYDDTFTLTFEVALPVSGGAARTPTPTPTARPQLRPQLLVSSYRADVAQLQPGSRFTLEMDVRNMGSAEAKRVTLIVGGGTASGGTVSGTPQPGGGVSGAGGEFTNFAPVDSSNVQSLGDLSMGGRLQARQTLIVNASTKAGAYPLKLSFIYTDGSGNVFTDDQVITLLVYQTPQVEISFYRDPGPLFAFQPNQLPLQVVNLSRNSALLGNMKVNAEGAQFSNNVQLIGALEPGGTFPLDATLIPEQPGSLELVVTLDYTDDFNQPQQITARLTVEVLESAPIDPGFPDGEVPDGGFPPPPVEETWWDIVVRFLRGLFGLDSAPPQPGDGGIVPEGEFPPGEQPPVIVPGTKG
jgi:uncharacterized repeat protein (TIGR01451 family)